MPEGIDEISHVLGSLESTVEALNDTIKSQSKTTEEYRRSIQESNTARDRKTEILEACVERLTEMVSNHDLIAREIRMEDIPVLKALVIETTAREARRDMYKAIIAKVAEKSAIFILFLLVAGLLTVFGFGDVGKKILGLPIP